jgi:prophage regulatory protein
MPSLRRILRKPAVRELTGYSDTQIWRLEKAGQFPARLQIGPGAVGWYSDEIEAWIETRTRGFGRNPTARAAA